jgi:hypothetical protein
MIFVMLGTVFAIANAMPNGRLTRLDRIVHVSPYVPMVYGERGPPRYVQVYTTVRE